MNRQELIKEVIEKVKPLFSMIDLEDENGHETLEESQIELIETIWGDYDDFKNTSDEVLEEWLEELIDIEYYV